MRPARLFPLCSIVATLASALLLVEPLEGCGSDEAQCRDDVPPASFDPQTPSVAFARDVKPIFKQSCAFTSCHGSLSGSSNGVFLGGEDPQRVHAAIVGVKATKLPTMALVEPADPRASFLLRKMDGSHCVLDAQCTGGDCGQVMPRNGETLPVESRDTVRRWIAQGAKND